MTVTSPQVFILGGNGFTGRALLRAFSRKLGADKVAAPNSSEFDLMAEGGWEQLAEGLDASTILVAAARCRSADPFAQFEGEVRMAANVARALALKRIRKCVYFSTLSVYDDTKTNLAVSEETPVNPASFYGLGKHAAESLLRLVADRQGIPLLIFRPCKIYGPGDPSGAYGPAAFMQAALDGDSPTLYGDGSELRDHLLIDDLVDAALPLSLGEAVGVFNLASGESHSFAEMLSMVRHVVGRNVQVVRQERTRPLIDQKIAIGKLCSALPQWRPTPLAEGLRLLYRSLKAE